MEQTTEAKFRSSWAIKFIECLFAALAVTNTLSIFIELLPQSVLIKLGESFFNWLLTGQVILALVFAISYAVYWHFKARKNAINSGVRHGWFRAVLRYWLAFDIATYGFAKILKTQFAQSLHRDDTLVGSLNGFNLTWNYFAHSYTLAVIIGLCQIIGSVLLLFRKTTLLGVAILLPILINILLINVFFDIASGAFLNSVLFTLGLVYLLLLRYKDLKAVFLDYVSPLPVIGYKWLRYLLKVAAIAAAYGLIFYFASQFRTTNKLVGKWKVETLIKNNDTLQADAWLKDSTAWKNIYMEEGTSMILCPNPYVCEMKRSLRLNYSYNAAKNNIEIVYWKDGKPDTSIIQVSGYNGKLMQWNTVFQQDTLLLQLSKTEKKK